MLTVDYDLLGIRPGERVLDVGCGEGRHASRACQEPGCIVYALDIDRPNVAKTNYLLHLMDEEGKLQSTYLALQGNALRLPFQNNQFDRIICSEVLEHVPDDVAAVKELKRILKDDGTLALSVPTYFSEAIYWKLSPGYHHQPGGHIRKYRRRQLVNLLHRQGLAIYAVRHKHGLHFFYWLLRCLFGIHREKARIPALYHRFLVWDIMNKTRPVRLLESLLNPLIAKSLVLYIHKNSKEQVNA